jgi:hypothetical protein
LGARSGSCRREPLTVPATGAVRIPDGGLAPDEVCGRHHGGELAMEIRRCRSCQFIGAQAARVEGVRGVQHEEDVETNVRARPRGGSQQWLVVMPHTAMPSHPCSRNRAARSGDPRNAECTDFATSRSGSPVMTSLNGVPTAVRAQRRASLPRVLAYEHHRSRSAGWQRSDRAARSASTSMSHPQHAGMLVELAEAVSPSIVRRCLRHVRAARLPARAVAAE